MEIIDKGNSIKSSSQRIYSLDMLRIVSMFLIVGSHIIGHCIFGIYGSGYPEFVIFQEGSVANKIIGLIFIGGGDMGNYVFFLLEGFFYDFDAPIKKRLKSTGALVIQCFYYTIVAFMIFLVSVFVFNYRYEDMGHFVIIKYIISLMFPATSEAWWFITTYLFIYFLLSPFGKIKWMTTNGWKKLIFLFGGLNLIRFNSGSYNKIFMCGFVVILGVLIRKLYEENKIRISRIILLAVVIITWLLAAVETLFSYKLQSSVSISSKVVLLLLGDAMYITKILFAVCILLFFLKIDDKKMSGNYLISILARIVFDVYLFHSSQFFIYLFFKKIEIVKMSYGTQWFIIVFLIVEFFIWLIAGLLHFPYSVIKDLFIRFISRKIESINCD